jgi:hypothetical protein
MIPGKGLYLAGTLERATSDLAPLVAALRLSSTHRPPGTMCPMLAMLPPQLVLIAKDGSMLSPAFPLEACGLVQPAVLAALSERPWQTVSVQVVVPEPGAATPSASPGGPSA